MLNLLEYPCFILELVLWFDYFSLRKLNLYRAIVMLIFVFRRSVDSFHIKSRSTFSMQLCGLPDIEEFAYKRENDSFPSSKYLCCQHFLCMFDVVGHLYPMKCFILPVHANDDSCVRFTAVCMHFIENLCSILYTCYRSGWIYHI